jgi:peptidoglycan/LPS O-acetylase OafA/YrhL
MNFIPTLTGIRALAAIMVLLFHQDFPHHAVITRGYVGVDLFFILSGFIISHVYSQALAAPQARTIVIFLWHRLIRLLPVHAAVLSALVLLIVALQTLGVPLKSDNWKFSDLPCQFLMVHAWGVTETATWNMPSWSISAEWFAYLLFPLLVLLLPLVPRTPALLLAPLVLLASWALFAANGWTIRDAWVGWPALVRVESEFLCGALLYRAQLCKLPRLGDALLLIGFAGYIVATLAPVSDFVLVGFLAVLIYGASASGPLATSVFGLRPVIWLGEISYSIYLVHFPALLILKRMADTLGADRWPPLPAMAANLVMTALVILAAVVLFYSVERPVRRRLRNAFGIIQSHGTDAVRDASAQRIAPAAAAKRS